MAAVDPLTFPKHRLSERLCELCLLLVSNGQKYRLVDPGPGAAGYRISDSPFHNQTEKK
jgi:hypothetical protein